MNRFFFHITLQKIFCCFFSLSSFLYIFAEDKLHLSNFKQVLIAFDLNKILTLEKRKFLFCSLNRIFALSLQKDY